MECAYLHAAGDINCLDASVQNRAACWALGLSLICSKFYLLFLPELPKNLTHYSYFMPTSSPMIPTYSCNFIVLVIIMSTHSDYYTGEQDID